MSNSLIATHLFPQMYKYLNFPLAIITKESALQ